MDLTLSRRGDYATRAALCLAGAFEDSGYRKIRELVAETEIPATFAAQILSDLVRAGLVTSRAGKQGGYRLTRGPDEVSMLEVVEAAEGPLRPEHCALGAGPCRWERVCPLHETWSQVTSGLRAVLAETSLAEVAARDREIALGTYEIPQDSHRSHPVAVDLTDSVQVELGAPAALTALARSRAHLGDLLEATASEVSVAPATRRRGKTPPRRYLVEWRVFQPSKASRFEGELAVSDVDAERCELELAGTWRSDEPLFGETPAETRNAARLALRTFLRNLARVLEHTDTSAERR